MGKQSKSELPKRPPPTVPTPEPRSERVLPGSLHGIALPKLGTSHPPQNPRFLPFRKLHASDSPEPRFHHASPHASTTLPPEASPKLPEMKSRKVIFWHFFLFFLSFLALWVGPKAFLGVREGLELATTHAPSHVGFVGSSIGRPRYHTMRLVWECYEHVHNLFTSLP